MTIFQSIDLSFGDKSEMFQMNRQPGNLFLVFKASDL